MIQTKLSVQVLETLRLEVFSHLWCQKKKYIELKATSLPVCGLKTEHILVYQSAFVASCAESPFSDKK